LQGELNLTRRRCGCRDFAKRRVGITAAIRSLHKRVRIRQTEVGVVQQIEELAAELKAVVFFDWRLLQQREVHVYRVGTVKKSRCRLPSVPGAGSENPAGLAHWLMLWV